jgi:protoporphyrinogen oxidase
MSINNEQKDTVILGGGLAGLSAGYVLSKSNRNLVVFESGSTVGGLSRTVRYKDFLFDLGGHRFFTKNKQIENFVRDILKGNVLTISRKSKIYLQNKFFDYPLKPANALMGLGMSTTIRAISDYSKEKVKKLFINPGNVSLEDWVVNNFGRTMFTLYFKDYSEKVWGIDCSNISEEWVSKRIEGLSLGVAIKNAFFNIGGKDVSTLVDEFIYPPMGIGEIADRMSEEIQKAGVVQTRTSVKQVRHDNLKIRNISVNNCKDTYDVNANKFVSSIPLTNLIKMLTPSPPDHVLEAASKLKYRDLVIVTVMLNRDRVTDLTWLYLPEQSMPLGRIHEPKNWSPHLAPEGKTHIVAEYFCFQDDHIWNSEDAELASLTASQLERLGFIKKNEVIDSCVVRVPKAYPILEVGYKQHYMKILDYLKNFENLHIVGRTGMFRYYNMDVAIESGIETAEEILRGRASARDRSHGDKMKSKMLMASIN